MSGDTHNLPSSDKFESRITGVTVIPRGDPLFSKLSTHISIEDEADGEFVKLRQEGGHTDYAKWITIDADEWPVIRDAIEFMFQQVRR